MSSHAILTAFLLLASTAAAEMRVDVDPAGRLSISGEGLSVGPFTLTAKLDGRELRLLGVGAVPEAVVDDALGRGRRLAFNSGGEGVALETTVTIYEQRALVTVVAELTGGKRCDGVTLALPAARLEALGSGLRVLAEAARSIEPPQLAAVQAGASGEGWAAFYSPASDASLLVGALTRRGRSVVTLERESKLETRDASDVLAIVLGRGPNRVLETYADAEAALAGAKLTARPAWGWTTWYATAFPDEPWVLANADSLAALDGGRGEAVVQVDDGWQDRVGDWQANEHFKPGMAALAAALHKKKVKAGIWVAPFAVAETSRVAVEHPEWLLRDAAGRPSVLNDEPRWGGRILRLDPRVPGVDGFLRALIARLTGEWGYDLVKIDFLDLGLIDGSRDAYRDALEAMYEGAKPGTTVLLSGLAMGVAPPRGELRRTGPDAQVDFAHHQGALRSASRRAFVNSAGVWADPDVLILRQELTDAESRSRLAFQLMAGGALLFGDNLASVAPERLALAARLLPPHPFRGRPLDLYTADIPALWELPLARGPRLVAAFNWDAMASERVLPVASAGKPVLVYDLWAESSLGVYASPLTLAVAAGDAALVAVVPVDDQPHLVASDAHFAGAALNLSAALWRPPEWRLTVEGKPASSLRLVVSAPSGQRAVAAAGAKLTARKDGLDEVVVALDAQGRASCSLSYAKAAAESASQVAAAPLVPPPGLRVLVEDEIKDDAAARALLAEVARGSVVVVLPPLQVPPAPRRVGALPWVEGVAAGFDAKPAPDTLAARVAALLGLPAADGSGVILATRPGSAPFPLAQGTRLTRGNHALVAVGDGLVLRLGRLSPQAIAAVIARLGDESVQSRLLAFGGEARRLVALAREELKLDGPWRFHAGDAADGFASPQFDDGAWETIKVPAAWESAGHAGYDGVAWYRTRVTVPAAWRGLDLLLDMPLVDDSDRGFFAGELVGETPSWVAPRHYRIAAAKLTPGVAQVVAVRVVDHGGQGGILKAVRLRPDPEAVLTRIGSGLIGFADLGRSAASLAP